MSPNNMFENNGMTSRYMTSLKPGSTFIILKKGMNGLSSWTEPIEFVIDRIDTIVQHNSADYHETYEATVLINADGLELILEDTFGMPMITGYDIYPNYQAYFGIVGKEVRKNITKIKRSTEYIRGYQAFKNQMIEENPEKLI